MYLLGKNSSCAILALSVVVGGVGCGSGSDGGDVSVVDIEPATRVVSVGSGTVVAVDITYDSDRVIGGDNFYAVVRLPAELRLREGSAEIDGFTSEDDNSIGPIVTNCAEGEQFLAFEFSHTDLLRAANPSGNADMRLNMTVDGVRASVAAVMGAAAEEDLPPFSCGNLFIADQDEALQIQ